MDFSITTCGIGRRNIIKKVLTEHGYEVKQLHLIGSDWANVIKVKSLEEAYEICKLLCMNPDDLSLRISEV